VTAVPEVARTGPSSFTEFYRREYPRLAVLATAVSGGPATSRRWSPGSCRSPRLFEVGDRGVDLISIDVATGERTSLSEATVAFGSELGLHALDGGGRLVSVSGDTLVLPDGSEVPLEVPVVGIDW
jgi:hypothetical protein